MIRPMTIVPRRLAALPLALLLFLPLVLLLNVAPAAAEQSAPEPASSVTKPPKESDKHEWLPTLGKAGKTAALVASCMALKVAKAPGYIKFMAALGCFGAAVDFGVDIFNSKDAEAKAQRLAEAEAERVAAERRRVAAERLRAQAEALREAQRLEAQRLEAQRLEAQRLEAQRLEAERRKAADCMLQRIMAELIMAERSRKSVFRVPVPRRQCSATP